MKRTTFFLTATLVLLVTGSSGLRTAGQTEQQLREQRTLTPADLGVNALTLPASDPTAQSNIIDLRGVKAATIQSTCTQPNVMRMHYRNDDGSGGIGTITTVPTPRLPLPAITIYFVNTGATPGTCTARA